MLTTYRWANLSASEKEEILRRPVPKNDVKKPVEAILQAVKSRGDEALFEFTREWDGVYVSELKAQNNSVSISEEALSAIKQAIETITRYHKAMLPNEIDIPTANGVMIKKIIRPIEKVGFYVPGGNNTPLISSVLMQAIPASVAGCSTIILCTPPNPQGFIDPHLLTAAKLCGVDRIFAVGGAQAIAAMAYGTQTIPKVDKIFGPGNSFVTEAKTQIAADQNGCAIDMPAGPSEVMVCADNSADPAFVAADLLAQAEHGIDSQVLLICESLEFARRVEQKLLQQLGTLNRKPIIEKSLINSRIIICENREEQLDVINSYAPEHLIINRSDAANWVGWIQNAGSIFLGPWSAETLGDYVSGSNHVLPTNGFARSYSGLSTCDFVKSISVQTISEAGIATLGKAAETLALLEGLDAHANAITIRLNALEL